MNDQQRIEDLERQLAEAREQAERLAVAFDSDAFRAIDGAVSPREALNIDGILAAHDSRVRAETLRAAADASDRRAMRWRVAIPPEERMAQICDNTTKWLHGLADKAERGEWPKKS